MLILQAVLHLSVLLPKTGIEQDSINIPANSHALIGSLTTYKLFGVTYGNDNHFKSAAMCLPSPLVPQAGW